MNNNINLNNNPNVGDEDQEEQFVIVNEVWTNPFSTTIFKTGTDPELKLTKPENQELTKNAKVETNFDFEQDNNGNLVFKEDQKNIYNEDIRIKASNLFKLLNVKNENVTGDTLREVYKAFAEFRCSLTCYLDSRTIADDIYNYYNWCPWISDQEFKEAQQKLFELQEILYGLTDDDCRILVPMKRRKSDILILNEQKNEIEHNIENLENKKYDLQEQLKDSEWRWYYIFLWILLIVPGLIHEIRRREQICDINSDMVNTNNNIDKAREGKDKLQERIENLPNNNKDSNLNDRYRHLVDIFDDVKNAETEVENRKLAIFKESLQKSNPELLKIMDDDKLQDIIFNIERQLNLLQQYEVFFNNLLLQLNDPEFLNRINGKSLDEFFRDQSNNFVVNFIDKKKQGFVPADAKIAKNSKTQGGATDNTYQIALNGENYYLKGGHLFLDELRERFGLNSSCANYIDMENRVQKNQIAIYSEVYRGNLKLEVNNWLNILPNEKAKIFDQPPDQKQTLIDTSLHGLAENIFANFLGLDNFLVDSKLAITEQGYSILMKEAEGKLGDDLVKDLFLREKVYLGIGNFLFCNQNYFNPNLPNPGVNPVATNMQINYLLNNFGENQLNNLQNNNLVSPQLQNSILWINILDYICGNFDRHFGNYFMSENKVTGIDSEGVFPTDNHPNRAGFMPLTPQDLPNLIPFATKAQYDKIMWLDSLDGRVKVADAIKIAIKTTDKDTLHKVITAAWERIDNLQIHFINLKNNGWVFDDESKFDSNTAKLLAKHSRLVSIAKQNVAQCMGKLNNFTGTGFGLWTVTNNNILPKLKQKPRDNHRLF